MPQLSQSQFEECLSSPMRKLSAESSPPFDFWDYVDGIPIDDFEGHSCDGTVSYVWEDSTGKYQHVLLSSQNRNVFMIIVLDVPAHQVHGHRLLDLDELYGLSPGET